MKLQYCADIRSYWEPIRVALQKVVDKIHPDWIPEDVYVAVITGQARVYLAHDGVIVFKLTPQPYTGENDLFVWAAHSNNGNALIEYADDVEAIAREFGATRILFTSPRKGMEALPERIPGWRQGDTIYEKRI